MKKLSATKLSVILIICSVVISVVSLFILPSRIAVQWENLMGGAVTNTIPKYLGILISPAVTALGAYMLRAKNNNLYIFMCILGTVVGIVILLLNLL